MNLGTYLSIFKQKFILGVSELGRITFKKATFLLYFAVKTILLHIYYSTDKKAFRRIISLIHKHWTGILGGLLWLIAL